MSEHDLPVVPRWVVVATSVTARRSAAVATRWTVAATTVAATAIAAHSHGLGQAPQRHWVIGGAHPMLERVEGVRIDGEQLQVPEENWLIIEYEVRFIAAKRPINQPACLPSTSLLPAAT